ncbi:uncharacterized protein KLLA0_D00209g [Kluyveromyces lactis]|uniref:KLLA0B00220p n=1 Tax=Kluyveromyces lactis (strain ATCC 8585 / CBS 2359 / DSM 70799 / NBRC 1267 / NRRL Y-1140 / WM37) TaxID=284590 RepID=Q6CSK9_KLULA|nr:uncharacterized protein KLLA0_B00220g [Kluyveromyces lactis]XP_453080.2 uncharacterized protein KLLA0_D00209g [Kluyveromyces lactis]CAH00176.2 KLLA0D00209p [Kluyveromyces lactis]CAH01932.1 KLLA0B00220p [Kluyveromyces lactis]|eukprot:XP_451539.1 uncharacterized protein KLLA0_B00220g [Kluyveromyces lactis]
MSLEVGGPTLFCTEQYVLPIDSSTTLGDAIRCGRSWGSRHPSDDWLPESMDISPPIYNASAPNTDLNSTHRTCGPYFILAGSSNITLLQAWQCGVLAGNRATSSSSNVVKTPHLLYLMILIAYFV